MSENSPPPSSPPPIPQSLIERALAKLTAAINSTATVLKYFQQQLGLQARQQLVTDRKIDALVEMTRAVQSALRALRTSHENLVQVERDLREDMREIRRSISAQTQPLVEASMQIREVRDDVKDLTPIHGVPLISKEELDDVPSGVYRGGINLTWGLIARWVKKALPYVTLTGLGALARHVYGWLSHGK